MIKRIVPVVPVTKLEGSFELLVKVGFEVNWIHTPGVANLRYASLTDAAGNELHLSESRGDGTGPIVVYFWVYNIDELAAVAGTSAADQTWGTREFWLKDPDGNTYRFGQLL